MNDPQHTAGQDPSEAQPGSWSHPSFRGSPQSAPETQQPPTSGPSTPQDAPWPPTPTATSAAPAPAPVAAPAPAQPERPEVQYLPRPTGPNLGLVLFGLVVIAVAAGVYANQVSGFQLVQLRDSGPGALVIAGLALAVIGIVGMVARRRH